MLAAFGIVSFVILIFVSPLNKLLLWALLFQLFDHQQTINLGNLIPAITFDRVFVGAILVRYVLKKDYGLLIRSNRFRLLEKAMVLFVIIFVFQIYAFYRPKDATKYFISFFESFMMPFLLYFLAKYYVRTPEDADKLLKALVAGAVISALIGSYEQLSRIDLIPYVPKEYTGPGISGLRGVGLVVRANGPFMAPEAFGGTLSIIWFVALFKYRTSTTEKSRLAYFMSILVISAGVISCMFRSIWLGLVVGVIASTAFGPARGKRGLRLLTIIFLVVLFALVAFGQSDFMSAFLEGRLFNVETLYSRFASWRIAWWAFEQNPLFGIGYGRFQYYASHLNIDKTVTFWILAFSRIQQ